MSEVNTKERPILFSTPMVQAILEGRKTQTRRIVSKSNSLHSLVWDAFDWSEVYVNSPVGLKVKCKGQEELWRIWPKWEVGDILWVREKTRRYYETDVNGNIDYDRLVVEYATDKTEEIYLMDGDGSIAMTKDGEERFVPWKPSIHMPRSACRIRLQITDIRVERLQDVSEEDAKAEGVERFPNGRWKMYGLHHNVYDMPTAHDSFRTLWRTINGEESWNANPWVWAIAFKGLQ